MSVEPHEGDLLPEHGALAAAWRAWDQRPGDPTRIAQLEVAVRAVADLSGHRPLHVRRAITKARREGGSYLDAIHTALRRLDAWKARRPT